MAVLCCAVAEKRVKAAFREEGLEDYQVPKDLPIEAIAREVQQSWQLKVRAEPCRAFGFRAVAYRAGHCGPGAGCSRCECCTGPAGAAFSATCRSAF